MARLSLIVLATKPAVPPGSIAGWKRALEEAGHDVEVVVASGPTETPVRRIDRRGVPRRQRHRARPGQGGIRRPGAGRRRNPPDSRPVASATMRRTSPGSPTPLARG